jgi:hypothetical protein
MANGFFVLLVRYLRSLSGEKLLISSEERPVFRSIPVMTFLLSDIVFPHVLLLLLRICKLLQPFFYLYDSHYARIIKWIARKK